MGNNNSDQCKICGCNEFCTKPNRYDIYESNQGILALVRSEYTTEGDKLYCRDCSNPLDINKNPIK